MSILLNYGRPDQLPPSLNHYTLSLKPRTTQPCRLRDKVWFACVCARVYVVSVCKYMRVYKYMVTRFFFSRILQLRIPRPTFICYSTWHIIGRIRMPILCMTQCVLWFIIYYSAWSFFFSPAVPRPPGAYTVAPSHRIVNRSSGV